MCDIWHARYRARNDVLFMSCYGWTQHASSLKVRAYLISKRIATHKKRIEGKRMSRFWKIIFIDILKALIDKLLRRKKNGMERTGKETAQDGNKENR